MRVSCSSFALLPSVTEVWRLKSLTDNVGCCMAEAAALQPPLFSVCRCCLCGLQAAGVRTCQGFGSMVLRL
jgi:hypothetical protein